MFEYLQFACVVLSSLSLIRRMQPETVWLPCWYSLAWCYSNEFNSFRESGTRRWFYRCWHLALAFPCKLKWVFVSTSSVSIFWLVLCFCALISSVFKFFSAFSAVDRGHLLILSGFTCSNVCSLASFIVFFLLLYRFFNLDVLNLVDVYLFAELTFLKFVSRLDLKLEELHEMVGWCN